MIDRRGVLCGGAGLMMSGAAQAGRQCGFQPGIGPSCIVEADLGRRFYALQDRSQWCWAACIAMLFAYNDHPVSQARIVAEAYGGLANMPAQGWTMSGSLNRRWRDDRGERFTSRVSALFDPMGGVAAVTNDDIIASVEHDGPVLIGAGGHAVVLTAVQFRDTPWGRQVLAGGVFDPWPGRGKRGLSPAELVPAPLGGSLQYVAVIEVEDD